MIVARRSSIVKHIQRYAGKNSDRICSTKMTPAQLLQATGRIQDEAIIEVEQKVTKFFQTPVVIDEARTMSRELLNHRVQELRNIHGQE